MVVVIGAWWWWWWCWLTRVEGRGVGRMGGGGSRARRSSCGGSCGAERGRAHSREITWSGVANCEGVPFFFSFVFRFFLGGFFFFSSWQRLLRLACCRTSRTGQGGRSPALAPGCCEPAKHWSIQRRLPQNIIPLLHCFDLLHQVGLCVLQLLDDVMCPHKNHTCGRNTPKKSTKNK